MEEIREGGIGLQAIATGIHGAIYHYIMAIMVEKKCERRDAVSEAIALLDSIKESIQGPTEVSDGHP